MQKNAQCNTTPNAKNAQLQNAELQIAQSFKTPRATSATFEV